MRHEIQSPFPIQYGAVQQHHHYSHHFYVSLVEDYLAIMSTYFESQSNAKSHEGDIELDPNIISSAAPIHFPPRQ